jgi:hypothetical protein
LKLSDIQIRPIGAYFQNDQDGYVVNPASWNKIPVQWHPVIEPVKQSYLDHLGDNLHSIYLRGSLVRGLAVNRFSDFDSFAVIKEKGLRWENAPWAEELNKILSSKYEFIGELEMMLSSIDESLSLENPNLPMLIKTQSFCIFGEDLSPFFLKFKPDKTMMLNYRWIAFYVNQFNENKEPSPTELKNFLKVVIRTGFEIIMEEEGKYTPDLYLCFKSFSKYFPQKSQLMEKALFYYLNSSQWDESDRDSIVELGKFLVDKVKSRLL